jgi:hypothetical protein
VDAKQVINLGHYLGTSRFFFWWWRAFVSFDLHGYPTLVFGGVHLFLETWGEELSNGVRFGHQFACRHDDDLHVATWVEFEWWQATLLAIILPLCNLALLWDDVQPLCDRSRG